MSKPNYFNQITNPGSADSKVWNMIGTMSGTSGDGLDIVFCQFQKEDNQWTYRILDTRSEGYNEDFFYWTNKALDMPPDIYGELDEEYAILNASRINAFIEEQNIENIDAIISHGHTIYHEPGVRSLQLGNGQIIANRTNLPVLANLRTADVELGGQGAPIVPIGDKYLFADHRFCLNLGGIANVSVKDGEQIEAWDICGCNLLLNYFAVLLGMEYDGDGDSARSGNTNDEFLKKMLDWPYLNRPNPKSLEKLQVMDWLYKLPDIQEIFVEDALSTSVDFIVEALVRAIAPRIKNDNESILVTGGGAHNIYLIEKLSERLPIEVVVPEGDIVDYKEAMVMAFYGVLHLRKETNCIPSVTGASKAVSGGELFVPLK